MILSELIQGLPVTDVTADSRQVEPGAVFVAIPGTLQDGATFVPEAVARGAIAVVGQDPLPELPDEVVGIGVRDARRALSFLAAAFHGHPSRSLGVVGITGTNGKTTTAYLLGKILEGEQEAAVLGTIRHRAGRTEHRAARTTPAPPELHRLLAEARDSGAVWAVMEVSSHALDQARVEDVRFQGAVFTNLTQDHLDYHRDLEEYFLAKTRLFELTAASSHQEPWGVVSVEDPYGARLCERFGPGVIGFGRNRGEVRILRQNCHSSGLELELDTPWGPLDLRSPLVGPFNAENVTAAAATALLLGISPDQIARSVPRLENVPGRVERVDVGQPFTVLVDYAHTDAALRNLLGAVRAITQGRIITVFGCGGDRDRSKRAPMGEAAATGSDLVVVTSDNPRSEDPQDIIDQILPGVRRAGGAAEIEPDRQRAIALALDAARSGDTVLIAGKGHETEQILADGSRPFDDRLVVRELLADLARRET